MQKAQDAGDAAAEKSTMTNEQFGMEAEITAIQARMAQRLSREQIVAYELWAQIETADRPIADRTHDDWLALAPHMIKTVEVARDQSAGDAAKAMNAAWLNGWSPLPQFVAYLVGVSLNQPGR